MSSESAQIVILRDQLSEANAAIDFLRGELWFRAQDLWEARDCLYCALVLLAFCDACKNEPLSVLKDRFQEAERVGELLEALKEIDGRNAQLLEGAGIDLVAWRPLKQGQHSTNGKGECQ